MDTDIFIKKYRCLIIQQHLLKKQVKYIIIFYDYSKVEYVNCRTEVTIICPIHGEFKQMPYQHLGGRDCRKCGFNKISKNKTNSFENFIKEANKIHNGKYDYSKVQYVNKR